MFAKIEEVGEIELLDKLLYKYRINPERTSNVLGKDGAQDMWRKIADITIARRGLPLRRMNETQPFKYSRTPVESFGLEEVDFVIPFLEANERELRYPFSRPLAELELKAKVIGTEPVRMKLGKGLDGFDRIVCFCSSAVAASGRLEVKFFADEYSSESVGGGIISIGFGVESFRSVDVQIEWQKEGPCRFVEIAFHRDKKGGDLLLHLMENRDGRELGPMLRFYKRSPGYSRKWLRRCLESLAQQGVSEGAVQVIEQTASASANRNEGIGRCKRRLICFVDDDAWLLNSDGLRKLVEAMNDLDSDLIGPRILDKTGKIFCTDPFFDENKMPVPRGIGEKDVGRYGYSRMVPWLPSTFLLVRREVCHSIGGFDTNYSGSQFEDVDFCLKARSRGFRCHYYGEVAVEHANAERNNQFRDNRDYFLKKWGSKSELFEPVERKQNTV